MIANISLQHQRTPQSLLIVFGQLANVSGLSSENSSPVPHIGGIYRVSMVCPAQATLDGTRHSDNPKL